MASYHSRTINIKDESHRLKERRKAGVWTQPAAEPDISDTRTSSTARPAVAWSKLYRKARHCWTWPSRKGGSGGSIISAGRSASMRCSESSFRTPRRICDQETTDGTSRTW